jgi:hypothetical protein
MYPDRLGNKFSFGLEDDSGHFLRAVDIAAAGKQDDWVDWE